MIECAYGTESALANIIIFFHLWRGKKKEIAFPSQFKSFPSHLSIIPYLRTHTNQIHNLMSGTSCRRRTKTMKMPIILTLFFAIAFMSMTITAEWVVARQFHDKYTGQEFYPGQKLPQYLVQDSTRFQNLMNDGVLTWQSVPFPDKPWSGGYGYRSGRT